MRFTMTKEVKDCNDCPCTRYDQDMGATIPYCSHKKAPEGYGSVISGGRGSLELPDWCPLKKDSFLKGLLKNIGSWELVDTYTTDAEYLHPRAGTKYKMLTSIKVYRHTKSGELKVKYRMVGNDMYSTYDPEFQHQFIREESKWTTSQS